MLQPPCKDCPDRFPGCHSSCSKYLEFRKTLDEHNETEKFAKRTNPAWACTNFGTQASWLKKMNHETDIQLEREKGKKP